MRAASTSRPFLTGSAFAVALLCASGAAAQIRTDGSVGPAARALVGPAFVVPQTLGRLAGGNLFHSFATFNVGSGESATFTTATPGIQNVVSRVTGGTPSSINGVLSLVAANGAPDFFFINPAGITFGNGASIDVPGAFHAGTADYVKFVDGRFYADPQKASSFSSAAPDAFGFLGTSRAAVMLHDGATLVPRRTHGVSLVAGDIGVDNAVVAAGAGEIRLAAVGQVTAEVGFSGALPQGLGQITLGNQAALVSSSIGVLDGGAVALSAGQIAIDGGAYVYSTVGAGASGHGGAIDIAARGGVSVTGGGNISSDTASAGNAGAIHIRATDVLLDTAAYVFSSAAAGSTGRSGAVDVLAGNNLRIGGGASISTATLGAGGSETIRLRAANIDIGAAYVRSDGSGAGSAGGIVLDATGTLAMALGGYIDTSTDGSADAGAVVVRSGALTMDSKSHVGSLSLPGAAGRSGQIDIAVAGDATLAGGASLFSSTASAADAGAVRLAAARLRMDDASITSNAAGDASAGANGASGRIDVMVVGDVILRNHSVIDTSTLSDGNAGAVQLRADGITLGGGSRISSTASGREVAPGVVDAGIRGGAGVIDIAVRGAMVLAEDASITISSSTDGQAGAIVVSAGSLSLDAASISGTAGLQGGSGRGGSITVSTSGGLSLLNGASISANAAGSGAAGSVGIQAGSVTMDSFGHISSVSDLGSAGDAGSIAIRTAGDVSLRNGAFINSDAYGLGQAGAIDLHARNITLDAAGRISSVAFTGSTGQAGRIELNVSGDLALLNSGGQAGQSGQISTSTFSSGRGGAVDIRAGNLLVDGPGAGVVSFAQQGSTGAAGSIAVFATGALRILEGGLSSTTAGAGAAGSVQVEAARVLIDGPRSGISAAAAAGSSGQTGGVQVLGGEHIQLRNGAFVSISNDAVVADPLASQPTLLRLAAPEIGLQQAVATAASSGNVAASNIAVDFGRLLLLDRSGITTSANTGNGGGIRLQGSGAVALRASQVTTSVLGLQGNGGDISIAASALALGTGFIQANTAARDASGGLVRITVDRLVASGNNLLLGGDVVYDFRSGVFGFNVVQAAAPTGVSGVVALSTPVFDVTGNLRGLSANLIDAGGLGRSPCQASGGSSLALAGRGGLAPSAQGLLRAERGPVPAATQTVMAEVAQPLAHLGMQAALRSKGCL